jgi:hypothetical protein
MTSLVKTENLVALTISDIPSNDERKEVGKKERKGKSNKHIVTTLTLTTPTTRLASLPKANHMASDTVD